MRKNIVLTLVLVLMSACNKSTLPSSILTSSNCSLPCWNNITAGITTKEKLLEILKELSGIDHQSIRITNQSWNIFDNQITFSFTKGWLLDQKPRVDGNVYIINNIVSELTICGELGISISDVIKQIGKPEGILSGNNPAGDRTVILIHSKQGIAYWYSTNPTVPDQRYEIAPDTKIGCLALFDPHVYERLLEAKRFSNGYYNAEETLRVMYPWNGYGNLDVKYPPRQP